MSDKYFELVEVRKRKNHHFVIRFYPICDMCPWSIVHRGKEYFFFTAAKMLEYIVNHKWVCERDAARIETELAKQIKKLFGKVKEVQRKGASDYAQSEPP